ncbi:MAG: Gfo/Idh/MocA family oxidoreductase, partial [Candidatus Omnitrophota bacterium]
MKGIRVGMIRCDLHAYYYGALMFKYDPLDLRDDELGVAHDAYFYFYLQYNDPKKITAPTIGGFELVKVWDKDRKLAEGMSRIFDNHPTVCETFEEVSDNVDLVFIADCNGDGSDHLELALPSIKKKVPTFIDKPFTYDVTDARKLVKLAEKYKTPIMSLSMLRVLPHASRFRNRFAELGKPQFGVIKGGGIHAISLAQHLFGCGVESVEAMGQKPLAYVHLDYGGKSGRPGSGVILCCASGPTYHCSYYA